MKHKLLIPILIFTLIFISSKYVNCETDKTTNNQIKNQDIDQLIEQDLEFSLDKKKLKDGPIKIQIVGDTKHLFADEDFEKKEVVLLGQDNQSNISKNVFDSKTETNKTVVAVKKNKSSNPNQLDCLYSNLTDYRENNKVQLVNGSRLTNLLSESETNTCFLVLFYVPWCQFSTRLAPIYNALPRAFPNLDILAFDVSKSVGYNTKFGTSAVPMILLFQNKNVLAKFNYTSKNLNDYMEFISKNTGFDANKSVSIIDIDLEGPVPTLVVERFDYYLAISWIIIIISSLDFLIRKTKLKLFLIKLIKIIITILKPRKLPQLPHPPEIPMIQHHNPHLHND